MVANHETYLDPILLKLYRGISNHLQTMKGSTINPLNTTVALMSTYAKQIN